MPEKQTIHAKDDRLQPGLSFFPLLGIIFFSTSGGPYGMEDLASGGPALAVVLLVVTPLVWSLPLALVAAELGAMLPVEGGYYRWVSLAMGRFWGFQMGWWNWLSSFLDMALYPALFVKSLLIFLPQLTGPQQWSIKLAVILSSLMVNLCGVTSVGRSAIVVFVFVNLPFLLLTVLGVPKMTLSNVFTVPWHDGRIANESIGLGLCVALWSYSGWECVSTFAGEVKEPARTIPLATIAAVPLVALLYLLPLGVALGAGDWTTWNSQTHTISQIAGEIVAPWLGSFVSLVILASSWSLYNSLLLSNSRLPFAMAQDGLLPAWIGRLDAKGQTPARSLILCSVVYALFTIADFRALVIVDALMMSITALLLIASLAELRLKKPTLMRPYKLPGGWPGVFLAGASLTACAIALFYYTILGRQDTWEQAVIAAGLLATGPLAYFIGNRQRSTNGKFEQE
jgi:amino acid transporter